MESSRCAMVKEKCRRSQKAGKTWLDFIWFHANNPEKALNTEHSSNMSICFFIFFNIFFYKLSHVNSSSRKVWGSQNKTSLLNTQAFTHEHLECYFDSILTLSIETCIFHLRIIFLNIFPPHTHTHWLHAGGSGLFEWEETCVTTFSERVPKHHKHCSPNLSISLFNSVVFSAHCLHQVSKRGTVLHCTRLRLFYI